ncbi:O-antigen ligase family protein [bacterium]|nr:O-antigen ligase family protein [bacterium]
MRSDPDDEENRGGGALLAFGLLCFCAWLSASADGAALTGGALALAGGLMVRCPLRTRVPLACWLAAAVWLCGSLAAFLPASLMDAPAWRGLLEAAGIDTGRRITPQPLAALGSLAEVTAIGVVALWAANQRPGRRGMAAMAFAVAVAIYALLAWLGPGLLHFRSNAQGTFGFFPNRNHSATLGVMGAMVALGLLTQGVRRGKPWQIGGGLGVLGFLLWVLFSLSISRAGLLLAVIGAALWLILAGRRQLGGNVGKAIALVAGGGLLVFLLVESPVKTRLEQALGRLQNDPAAQQVDPLLRRLEQLDSRGAIHRDTRAMIAGAPWTGWGKGQFAVVFPQYQQATGDLTKSQCLHPESDWLWMAAESGWPATLALAALGLAAVLPVIRAVRTGRSRALRAGLLTACLILPIHGLFDVPGHGFSLLWTSALLLALASGPPRAARWPRISAAGWRLAGLAVAGFGLLLAVGTRPGGQLPAARQSARLMDEALAIYQNEHRPGGAEPAPGAPEPLETGLAKLAEAAVLTPLDPRVHGLRGMLALHFDEHDDLARRSFAAQRALEPSWVALPLHQAAAWSKINPAETASLWREAMRRADESARGFPGTPWREETYERILTTARGIPELEAAARQIAGDNAGLMEKARRALPPKDAKFAH